MGIAYTDANAEYQPKMNPAYAEPEPKPGNIAVLRHGAYKQLAELDDELRHLDENLTPILRAARPVAEDDMKAAQSADEPNRSDLAVALDDLCITARRLTRHVRDLIDRVDL